MIFQILTSFMAPDTAIAAEKSSNSNLYNYQLENLSRFSKIHTESFKGHNSVWISIQPNCSSCKTQLKNLDCLPQKTRKIALGIRGTREELSKILRPLSFKGDQLLSSHDLSKNLSLQATPTILIVDSNGDLQKKIIGSQRCETLKAYLDQLNTTQKKEI